MNWYDFLTEAEWLYQTPLYIHDCLTGRDSDLYFYMERKARSF